VTLGHGLGGEESVRHGTPVAAAAD
jgi:hypothetical protein